MASLIGVSKSFKSVPMKVLFEKPVIEFKPTPNMIKSNKFFLKMLKIIELRCKMNKECACRFYDRDMAEVLGVSITTVQNWLKELEAGGYISRWTSKPLKKEDGSYARIRFFRSNRVFLAMGLGHKCDRTRKWRVPFDLENLGWYRYFPEHMRNPNLIDLAFEGKYDYGLMAFMSELKYKARDLNCKDSKIILGVFEPYGDRKFDYYKDEILGGQK